MNKKIYTAPNADLILLAPSEAVTASWNWNWTWKWNQDQQITASIQATNPIWLEQEDNNTDPY